MSSTDDNTSMKSEEQPVVVETKNTEKVSRYNLRSSRRNSDCSMESERKVSLEEAIERIVKDA